jgi:hypothetical protein
MRIVRKADEFAANLECVPARGEETRSAAIAYCSRRYIETPRTSN